jgi:hypothetical protein
VNANSAQKSKPEVESVSFRPAKGGMISETHMRIKRGGQGGGPVHDYESNTAVHPDMKSAHAHLTAMLGHSFEGPSRESVVDEKE